MADSLQNVPRNLRIVSCCTLVSRVFGLLRDQAMGALFGAGPLLDAFTVAFRLPNLARVLLGEGALTTAFMPIFVDELHQRGTDSAARVAWAVFVALASVLCTICILVESILWIVMFCVELSPQTNLLLVLSSILLPYVILICLAAQLAVVLNAIGQFVWPALVPVVLNVVWLSALWFLIPLWTDIDVQIHVTAVCVIIAGTLQMLILLPVVRWFGFGYRNDWPQALGSVRGVARDMIPVVIGLSITQINAVIDSFMAWGFSQPEGGSPVMLWPGSPHYPLTPGTVTALYLGQRLYQFPLGVYGVALGTVLYPLLTRHAQRGEFDKLRTDLSLGIRLVIAIGLPASAGLMLIAHPLASLFFQYGKFDADAARMTGDMILCYGSGVSAYSGLLILQRGCYATGDRITPMYIGMCAVFLNLLLNLTLVWPLGGRGLALSTSLVATLQCIATCWRLQHRVGSMAWNEIAMTAAKTLLCVCAMSIICLMLRQPSIAVDSLMIRAGKLIIPLMAGLATFFLFAWFTRLREPWMVLSARSHLESPETTADS